MRPPNVVGQRLELSLAALGQRRRPAPGATSGRCRRLGRPGQTALDGAPLGGDDLVQLLADVGQHVVQLVARQQLLARLGQPAQQSFEAAHPSKRPGSPRMPRSSSRASAASGPTRPAGRPTARPARRRRSGRRGAGGRPSGRSDTAPTARCGRRVARSSDRVRQLMPALAPVAGAAADRSLLSRRLRCRPSSTNSTADATAAGDAVGAQRAHGLGQARASRASSARSRPTEPARRSRRTSPTSKASTTSSSSSMSTSRSKTLWMARVEQPVDDALLGRLVAERLELDLAGGRGDERGQVADARRRLRLAQADRALDRAGAERSRGWRCSPER